MEISLSEFVLALTPILLAVMGYLIYRKPQDIVKLLEANQERWRLEKVDFEHQISVLQESMDRETTAKEDLQKMVDAQREHLLSLLSIFEKEHPVAKKTLGSWKKVYQNVVNDGLEKNIIRADVFLGRSGYHSTDEELGRFVKYGLVTHNRETQEIEILKKGHVIGQVSAPQAIIQQAIGHSKNE